jgi:hypothetical protein
MIHIHHRKKRRAKDDRPVNKIGLPDVIHEWVEANPKAAMECGLWVKQGDDPAEIMVTIPEEALKKVRARGENLKGEAKRNRATYPIKVPKDEREDGAGLMDDYVVRGRELIGLLEERSEEEASTLPVYNVVMKTLAKGLEAMDDELRAQKKPRRRSK